MDFFAKHYDLFRALHIMAVIAWMAGLMYLPRLYVYHSKATLGTELDETLKTMERKLYHFIMQPSMVVVWALGLSLIMARGGMDFISIHWVWVKLFAVISITLIHFMYGKWQKEFSEGKRPLSHVFFRFINEAPFLLMIIAVLMVVLEPNF